MKDANRGNILLWGISENEFVFSALAALKVQENSQKILLILPEDRLEKFKTSGVDILTFPGKLHALNVKLLSRLLFLKVAHHVIPCGHDFNRYYGPASLINLISLFKKRTCITLIKDGISVKIPVHSQVQRPYFLYPLLAWGGLVLIFPESFRLLSAVLIAPILFFFFDRLFEAYMKQFHARYYLSHLMFKREEFPYLSHGWMHPFHESYFNRLVFSKEGPVENDYEIGADHFPFYCPRPERNSLGHHFDFLNTHRAPLDEPERTIFILGGSVAQGEIGCETSYHRILEKKLESHSMSFKVIPWAIGGYQSTQERIAAECALMQRKPFAVLSLDFYNDALFTIMGIPPGDTQRSQKKFLAKVSFKYNLLSLFFEHSAMARSLWQTEYSKKTEAYMQSLLQSEIRLNLAIRHCVSIYLENIIRIHQACEQEGIKHLAFIQPFRDDSALETLPVKRDGDNPKPVLINLFYTALAARIEDEDKTRAIFADKPVFRFEDFSDEVHLTKSGQQKIADHLFDQITKKLLKSHRYELQHEKI